MKLDTLLVVQTRTLGDELAGEPVGAWTDLRREWAKVDPISGREYLVAQQVNATTSHTIATHYFAGATSDMRLVRKRISDDAVVRQFNVESVINVGEANRWLEWRCEEVGVG